MNRIVRHVLICGYGYLGAAIAREFRNAGWRVSGLGRDFQPPGEELDAFFTADLADPERLRQLAFEIPAPDVIIHCASSGRGGAEAYRAVYLGGCTHLLAAFPDSWLVFSSSTSVYAQTDGSWVDEASPAEPIRETGRILREAENLVVKGRGTAIRLAGIYGPGRSMILKFFLCGAATVEESGEKFLNQIHRDDAARAMLLLADRPDVRGRIFNCCDSSPLSQRLCYTALATTFGKPFPPSAPRDLDRKRGWSDKRVSNRALKELGWSPEFPSFLDAVATIAPTLALD